MTAPSIEEYIDRLNQIPAEAISKLHQIRNLDKQVLILQNKIQKKRELALQKIIQFQTKPNSRLRSEISELLKQINDIHNSMLAISHKKVRLSDQIYNCIDIPTEQLNRDLSTKIKLEQPPEETKTSKYKRPNKQNQQQFFASEPSYCYCHRPSFGLMVKCENEHCQVEWFHRQCVEEKNLPEKWFCRDCRKTRGKGAGVKTRI